MFTVRTFKKGGKSWGVAVGAQELLQDIWLKRDPEVFWEPVTKVVHAFRRCLS